MEKWNMELEEKENISRENILSLYSVDITELAKNGVLEPVIGREKEIKRIIQILSRKNKNNVILVGEAGVGKTVLVDGLAQKIVKGDCPINLMDKKILTIEVSSLVAGTKYRGQFEERMRILIDEIKKTKDVIIFIDEIHTIVGAGGTNGSLDASNILKPALSRGIQCIGATTFDEYRKIIEKDSAFERRFQKVVIEEPSAQETKYILMKIKHRYEDYHHVKYTDEAIDLCVKLAERYMFDRAFPDKAIDIIDEAGARAHIDTIPAHIKELNEKIEKVVALKKESVRLQKFEESIIYRNTERELKNKLELYKEEWKKTLSTKTKIIDGDCIREIVSSITSIPVEKLSTDDCAKYIELENTLKKEIIGQDEAISAIARALRRHKTFISNPNKPIGTFMFLGSTGVGKTETAKVIANVIFGSSSSLIRIDMSEYSEKISISRLTGAAPGYVGYEEGGQLTEAVRKKPYSVVLFDEIEKAHPDVYNILLQILDEGRLTDNTGRVVSFKNTIIIMTSNVGVKEALLSPRNIGFNSSLHKKENIKENDVIKNNIIKSLKNKFSPEFLNRINEIIIFNQLSEDDVKEIVKIHLNRLKNRIKDIGYNLTWSSSVVDYIAKETYDPLYGARPVERGIQKLVEDKIAEELLKLDDTQQKNSNKIKIKYNKNKNSLSIHIQ